jgi:hypothetical protein
MGCGLRIPALKVCNNGWFITPILYWTLSITDTSDTSGVTLIASAGDTDRETDIYRHIFGFDPNGHH